MVRLLPAVGAGARLSVLLFLVLELKLSVGRGWLVEWWFCRNSVPNQCTMPIVQRMYHDDRLRDVE